MKSALLFLLVMFVGLGQFGCRPDSDIATPNAQNARNLHYSSDLVSNTSNEPCGTPMVVDFLAGQHIHAGTVQVHNTGTNVVVTFTTLNGWQLRHTHLYVGHCDSIPKNGAGNPQIGNFPYQTAHSPYLTTYTYTFPLSDFDACFCWAAHAEVVLLDADGNVIQAETAWGNGTQFVQEGGSWAMFNSYCKQECPPPATDTPECNTAAGSFRTQTQGGWGSVPRGINPGSYQQANFATAFPNGLTVGCGSNTITLTSGQAVTDFLPQGGTPNAIQTSYVDPTSAISVLAGQITAATLSVTFDAADPNYSSSPASLGSLVIASGTFQGMTVNQLLAIANQVLGGCNTTYSLSDVNQALTAVNENFVDGRIANGFLTCPGAEVSSTCNN